MKKDRFIKFISILTIVGIVFTGQPLLVLAEIMNIMIVCVVEGLFLFIDGVRRGSLYEEEVNCNCFDIILAAGRFL